MEPEELDVCSSSSESSDSEESLCSEEIEVDGDKEVILVPRKQKVSLTEIVQMLLLSCTLMHAGWPISSSGQ